MATFKEVLSKAMENDRFLVTSVNQNMIEVAKATKRKSAFVKTAITDELASGLLYKKRVAFILHIDADELNALNLSLDTFTPVENETKEDTVHDQNQ